MEFCKEIILQTKCNMGCKYDNTFGLHVKLGIGILYGRILRVKWLINIVYLFKAKYLLNSVYTVNTYYTMFSSTPFPICNDLYVFTPHYNYTTKRENIKYRFLKSVK